MENSSLFHNLANLGSSTSFSKSRKRGDALKKWGDVILARVFEEKKLAFFEGRDEHTGVVIAVRVYAGLEINDHELALKHIPFEAIEVRNGEEIIFSYDEGWDDN